MINFPEMSLDPPDTGEAQEYKQTVNVEIYDGNNELCNKLDFTVFNCGGDIWVEHKGREIKTMKCWLSDEFEYLNWPENYHYIQPTYEVTK